MVSTPVKLAVCKSMRRLSISKAALISSSCCEVAVEKVSSLLRFTSLLISSSWFLSWATASVTGVTVCSNIFVASTKDRKSCLGTRFSASCWSCWRAFLSCCSCSAKSGIRLWVCISLRVSVGWLLRAV